MKSEETAENLGTKETILNAALKLFSTKGFEKTTMRAIAAEADVATGAAYYYFKTKEDLVLAFYVESCSEFMANSVEAAAASKSFSRRLTAVMESRLAQLNPYRPFLGALLRVGVDPNSQLSPFSAETSELREMAIGVFRTIIEGSALKIPASIAPHLPRLLWLYHLGIIFYWLHDSSPNQAKTRRLSEVTQGIMIKILKVIRLPVIRSLTQPAIRLLDELA